MGTEVQTRQEQGGAVSPMVQLRASLLKALETQQSRIGGIIDKRHVLIACEQIEANHALLNCSPASIFRAILRAGFYGWVCDGLMGQGYLVPFKGEATLIAGYKGLRDLVRRSGQADTLMEAVHEGDTFELRGTFAEPLHIKSEAADRRGRPVTGAYVVVFYHASKTVKTFYWTVGQIMHHRDQFSIGWKKRPGPDNLWHEKNPSFPVMCMKTVLRDVVARGEAPVSLDDRNIILRDPDRDPEATGSIDVAVVQPTQAAIEAAIQEVDVPAESETVPEGPRTAEDRTMQSDAMEREYRDLLPGLKTETEIRGLISDAEKHAELTADAKGRIKGEAEKRIGELNGNRGERSNKQKNMTGG